MRAAVFVSGSGSNLQAIIDAQVAGLELTIVFSNQEAPYAFTSAKKHGIATAHLAAAKYPDRKSYDTAVIELMQAHQIELIILAGYMLVIGTEMVAAFTGPIVNIHPALLPAFPGLNVQQKALDHGVKFSGCTVHFVDQGVDTGPIIRQAVVPVNDDDTPASLAQRILDAEHRIYPEALDLLVSGRLQICGRRVITLPHKDK